MCKTQREFQTGLSLGFSISTFSVSQKMNVFSHSAFQADENKWVSKIRQVMDGMKTDAGQVCDNVYTCTAHTCSQIHIHTQIRVFLSAKFRTGVKWWQCVYMCVTWCVFAVTLLYPVSGLAVATGEQVELCCHSCYYPNPHWAFAVWFLFYVSLGWLKICFHLDITRAWLMVMRHFICQDLEMIGVKETLFCSISTNMINSYVTSVLKEIPLMSYHLYKYLSDDCLILQASESFPSIPRLRYSVVILFSPWHQTSPPPLWQHTHTHKKKAFWMLSHQRERCHCLQTA